MILLSSSGTNVNKIINNINNKKQNISFSSHTALLRILFPRSCTLRSRCRHDSSFFTTSKLQWEALLNLTISILYVMQMISFCWVLPQIDCNFREKIKIFTFLYSETAQRAKYGILSQNLQFNLRRDPRINILWASRLWVCRRQEPILGYITKTYEEKNSGSGEFKSYIVVVSMDVNYGMIGTDLRVLYEYMCSNLP